MIKRLLSAALLAATVGVGAFAEDAFKAGGYVYTSSARYQLTGANLFTNSDFSNGTTGWTSVTGTALSDFVEVNEGGGVYSDENSLKSVASGKNGVYQAVQVDAAGTYVLVMKIKYKDSNTFSDLSSSDSSTDSEKDTPGVNGADYYSATQNYINLIYNQDGTPYGTTSRVQLAIGSSCYITPEYTTAAFALDITEAGYLIAELSCLAEDIEVTEVELHQAIAVYDDRLAQNTVDKANKLISAADCSDYGVDTSTLQSAIDNAQTAINSSDNTVGNKISSLNDAIDNFISDNFSEILSLNTNSNGAVNTHANWNDWTGKFNKNQSENTTNPYWTWTTDRWAHKTGSANTPVSLDWQSGSSGDWDNIATCKLDLKKGTYLWGMDITAARKTLQKADWGVCSSVPEVLATQLFFNGDTTEVFYPDPSLKMNYLYKFTLDEDKTVELGMHAVTTVGSAAGMSAYFYDPTLYLVLTGEGLSPDEEAYIKNAWAQLDELKSRIATAQDYVDNDATRPWGKEDLAAAIKVYQEKYDEFYNLLQDTDKVLDNWMYKDLTLSDTIYNTAGKPIKDTYIAAYTNMNAPFITLTNTIASAKSTKALRIYEKNTGHAAFATEISDAQAVYDKAFAASYNSEDSAALVTANTTLVAAIETFKNTVSETTLVDIDFGTQESPATIKTTTDDESGSTTYYIEGKQGTVILPASTQTGSYPFAMGYNDTDSLGMLRVGNGTATVAFNGTPSALTNIIKASFDFYYGGLSGKYAGFTITAEDGTLVSGIVICRYNALIDESMTTFSDFVPGNTTSVGSSAYSNAYIAASTNKTHFDVVLDYGKGKMYVEHQKYNGTSYSLAEVAIPTDSEGNVLYGASFNIYSNYSNVDRRCFFDNLKITQIEAGEYYDAITTVGAEVANTQKAGKYVKDGQLYIVKNGKSYSVAGIQY